jgi:predicted component of type VI protein secretion system
LDDILRNKLTELKSYATESDKAEQRVRETEKNLQWLEDIESKVTSILEI